MYVEQVSEELHNNLRSNYTKIHKITYILVKSNIHQISEKSTNTHTVHTSCLKCRELEQSYNTCVQKVKYVMMMMARM